MELAGEKSPEDVEMADITQLPTEELMRRTAGPEITVEKANSLLDD